MAGVAKVRALAVVLAVGGAIVTLRASDDALPAGTTADLLVLEKARRELTLLREGVVLERYTVALGRNPVGAKEFEGDGKTPEGRYTIDRRKEDSDFHRALHISYPDAGDRARAETLGRPPGGDIMIHGLRNGLGYIGSLHRLSDWTEGCIAVTNAEIEELWRAVPDGTPIEILP